MNGFYKVFFTIGTVSSLLIALNGCGGGSTSTQATPTYGTGHYMDSYVKGVEYTCGGKSGTTDEAGTFYFESGQDCTFKLGKLTLRYTPWDALSKSSTVFEDNVKVAQLLQSLDNDGNVSNGIEVPSYTLAAFNSIDPDNVTDSDGTIDPQKVADFLNSAHHSITLKDIKSVKEHLKKSLTDLLKKQITGKTFYMVFPDSNGNLFTDTLTINQEANVIQVSSDESSTNDGCSVLYPQNCPTQPVEANLSISGQDLNVTFQNNSAILHIADHDEKTLTLADDMNITYKLFVSQEDAQNYVHSLITPPTSTTKIFTYSGKLYDFDGNYTSPSYTYNGKDIVFALNFKDKKATVKLYANGRLHKEYANVDLNTSTTAQYAVHIEDDIDQDTHRSILAGFDNKAHTSLSGFIDLSTRDTFSSSKFKAYLHEIK